MDVFLRVYLDYYGYDVEQMIDFLNDGGIICDALINSITLYKIKVNRTIYKQDMVIVYRLNKRFRHFSYYELVKAVNEINFDSLYDDIDSFDDIDELLQKYNLNRLDLNINNMGHIFGDDSYKILYYYASTLLEDKPNDIKIALKN